MAKPREKGKARSHLFQPITARLFRTCRNHSILYPTKNVSSRIYSILSGEDPNTLYRVYSHGIHCACPVNTLCTPPLDKEVVDLVIQMRTGREYLGECWLDH